MYVKIIWKCDKKCEIFDCLNNCTYLKHAEDKLLKNMIILALLKLFLFIPSVAVTANCNYYHYYYCI